MKDLPTIVRQIFRRLATERQIYVQSEGKVQFFVVGSRLQVALVLISAFFLSWVAYITVIVVFKDRILAAQDNRFQQVQAEFENRLSDLQLSYESLQEEVAAVHFRADRQRDAGGKRQNELQQALDVHPAPGNLSLKKRGDVSDQMKPGRESGVVHMTFLWLFGNRKHPAAAIRNAELAGIVGDTARMKMMAQDATHVMAAIETDTLKAVSAEKRLIATTGLNAEQFLRRLQADEGMGGPEIPIESVQLDGVSDQSFSQSYFRSEANQNQLAAMQHAVLRLPLMAPVGPVAHRSSGFGPRLDPFSGLYAFHSGVDFAGPAGTPVLATAQGRVTFAGKDGGYGNMVEVDHGDSLRTRYAHLLKVLVAQGQVVAKGAILGLMGSTGRSTGPHVHYEVWYDRVVRNPDGFLRLGVLEHSGDR